MITQIRAHIAQNRPSILALCCLSLPVCVAQAQLVPQPSETDKADQKAGPRPVPELASTKEDAVSKDEVITLSPFEVTTNTKGYLASSTMSGTRFNTKLEDLASSLTVMTKEQMSDFAMLDVNDVFLYAANTEGTGTFTDLTVDRNGSIIDGVQMNPNGANRVRGLSSANISLGNFETMNRVPIDPLGVDAVEISRGPNANVFGLGSPSGTVNMVPSSANISRDRAQTTLRVDSYGGYRGTLDVNRVLLKDKLAIRTTGSLQHEAFVRKPSGVETIRYGAMVKYRPFPYTTVSANAQYYRSYGNRANAVPPRDNISYWAANGKPTWDPISQVIHLDGATLGPFPTTTGIPDTFSTYFGNTGAAQIFVDQSGIGYWSAPQATSSSTLFNTSLGLNTTGAGTARYMATAGMAGSVTGKSSTQPLFVTTPTVSDKATYDWSSINLSSVNRLFDKVETFSVQIDQIAFNTERNSLAFQFGMLREDAERVSRNIFGSANSNGQSGQLFIDINERLIDGSPNPYFLRPYLGQDRPVTASTPAKWDTYRGQFAYKLDLTKENNILKWLGWHQLTGYDEYKYRINRTYAFKDGIADQHAWIPANYARANQSTVSGSGQTGGTNKILQGYYRYYVGDANGNNVDYAPSSFDYGSYEFVWGNLTSGINREQALLSQIAASDYTGGPSNTKTILKTLGAVSQSHLLNDKVVITLGLRRDRQYVKTGSTPRMLNSDGITIDPETTDHWAPGPYKSNAGTTKTAGVVVRPFKDLSFIKRYARSGDGSKRFAAGFLQGMSLYYNQSDSFTPQNFAYDIFLRPLSNPTGKGKDFGAWLSLFDDKLVVRINKYVTKSLDNRSTDWNTMSQRVTRMDIVDASAFTLVRQARLWVANSNPSWSASQVEEEVSRQIGVPTDTRTKIVNAFLGTDGSIAATADAESRGTEIEVNYNSKRWTVAASFTETKASNSNFNKSVLEWIEQRMPIWTTIEDPRFPDPARPGHNQLWWTHNYGGSQTAAQNFNSWIASNIDLQLQQEGKSLPQVRRYQGRISASLQLAALSERPLLKKLTVGGALRWESRGSIGYYGRQQLPAQVTELDANNPIWDKQHCYFDAWIRFRTKFFKDSIPVTLQLNARNLQEGGRLQPIAAYPDGTAHSFRIVDPRQFIFTASFDL